MSTVNLLHLIMLLPLTERLMVVEQTLKSIRHDELRQRMALAADALYADYAADRELTAFTSLDYENFYEAR